MIKESKNLRSIKISRTRIEKSKIRRRQSETFRNHEKNLKIGYKKRDWIINAINVKTKS